MARTAKKKLPIYDEGVLLVEDADSLDFQGAAVAGTISSAANVVETVTGDVVGPASSTDNAIARFDSTTGKLLQNSTVTIGDTGGIVTTIANTGNAVGLTVTQNDTTNNPVGVTITNTGSGRSINIDHDGNSASAITGLWVNTANAGAGASYAAIFEAGNVGIGTTTPVYKLSILGGASSSLVIGQTIRNNDIIDGSAIGLGFSVNNIEMAKGAVIYERTTSYGRGKLNFALSNAIDNTTAATLADTKMTILNNGNVGIGQTTPTAVLHIKAGTATASTAPLKLTSGTLNTTAEAGAVEFLTDAYYGTITTGAARKQFAFNPMTTGGDLVYGGASGVETRLANGTAGQVLQSNGTTLAPTWVALAGGGNAQTANPLSQFAATTSAQLLGVISDETGSGALVFATSPTLVTPLLGTPTSGVMTNVTGTASGLTAGNVTTNANLTGVVTSTGNATAIANGAITNAMLVNGAVANLSGTNTGDNTVSTSGAATTAVTLLNARTIGGVSFDGSANITVATATGGFTISGGNLALGANSITMSGSIGVTGTRVTKGWFTDLEVTNNIVGGITGNAATVTTNANLTGHITSTGNAAILGSFTLAQLNTAVSDADVARTDAANTFTGIQTFSTPIATGSVATMSATVGGGVPTPPNNTTTFLRGDGTFAAPAGSGDMVLANAQTNSGVKTFLDATLGLRNVANSITSFFTNTATVARTYTLQNRNGTLADDTDLALKANLASPTFTGTVTIPTGASITTPVLTGLPTGTGVASAATASTLVARDANGNISADNLLQGYTTTVTAAGTTTLTVDSTYLQFFTGSTTQTLTLPVATTLVLGQQFYIRNNSTGAVTINSSGANVVRILAGNTRAIVTCILTSGTTAASWSAMYMGISITDGKILTASNTLTLAGTDATTMTFPATSATIARTDAAQTFTGVQTFVAPILGTPTSATLTNATGLPLTGLVSDTTTALGIGSINLGHASDTTLSRLSAGVLAVEGVALETKKSVLTTLGVPVVFPGAATVAVAFGVGSDILARGGLVHINGDMVVNNVSIRTGTVTVAGTVDITLLSENGATQIFSVTTASLASANTIYTTAVSAVSVPRGNYYLFINTNDNAANLQIWGWNVSSAPFGTTAGLGGDVASSPMSQGTVAITSGVAPTSITPTGLTEISSVMGVVRFDNA